MKESVFLAGATGAVGSALIPLLLRAGFTVYGGTRRPDRAASLKEKGVRPVIVDVFDAQLLTAELVRVAPWGVIHQLTDLPQDLAPEAMVDGVVRNARVREVGTRHLVAAAEAAGAKRLVAQSIAWAYAPGEKPYTEDAPLEMAAEGARRISVGGVAALEHSVLGARGIVAAVLRYGQLYGPGTSRGEPNGTCPVHVEAAAWAALLSLQSSEGGIFNIAEECETVSSEKAIRKLGWRATLRL